MLTLTSLSGGISFMENTAILCFIVILMKKYSSRNEQYDFIVQICFVCVNDIASSFILFWMGIIRVTGNGTAFFCALVNMLASSFQTMSLFNIMCICAFRYAVAKNIRKVGTVRQSRKTLVLVAVNISVAVFGISTFWITLELRSFSDGINIACDYNAVVTSKSTFLLTSIHFLLLLMCTVVADVLCLMTIYRLKREINLVGNSEVIPSVSASSTTQLRSTGNRTTLRYSQKHAIITILLLLVLFNVSLLPLLVAMSIVVSGTPISQQAKRITYLILFFNSLFNPIVIACRIQDIRKLLKQLWKNAKERCVFCCR